MSIEGVTGHTPDVAAGKKGLKGNALGLWSIVNMGIASTAPAYSLAATIGLVVIAVGYQAPIVMLLAFIPLIGQIWRLVLMIVSGNIQTLKKIVESEPKAQSVPGHEQDQQ